MSDTDQAITAIARLDLESSMVPNQYEVRGFEIGRASCRERVCLYV